MDQQTEERIRQRAYRLWQDDGSPEGRADEYWSRAEAQLNAEGAEEPPAPSVEQSDKRRLAGAPLEEDDSVPAAERERERRRGGVAGRPR
ncbi:MAG TPA: DUF2934 domain-containing protein [Paraburkholderia sp.]|jgi:hypothetical protein|nr:DUF2934 domain-containing protein [Paraburkholderia sp.]